jgi:hypothetical protein
MKIVKYVLTFEPFCGFRTAAMLFYVLESNYQNRNLGFERLLTYNILETFFK